MVPLTSEGVPLFTLLEVCESVGRRGPSNFRLKIQPHVHSYYISTRGKFYYRRGPNIVFFSKETVGEQSSSVASSTDLPLSQSKSLCFCKIFYVDWTFL